MPISSLTVTRGCQTWANLAAPILILLSAGNLAYAEGSAQMGLNQRLLDFDRSLAQGYASDTNSASLFVDVLAVNEVINISVCGSANGDSIDIEIFDPTDTSVFSTTLASGNIDCADTMTAPLTNPVRYTATAIGAYRIVLQNTASTAFAASFFERYDISVTADAVTDPDPTVAAGRLWAYSWNFNAGSFAEIDSTDANYYVLVPGGRPNTNYTWLLDLNKMAGFGYNIVANDVGVDAPNSGYSTPTAGNSVSYKFPVYTGIPAIADPRPTDPPSVTNLRFIDSDGIDGGISPGTTIGVQDSGVFEFFSDVTGTYAVFIDIDQNGIFGNAGDVLILGNTVVGLNPVPWDGRDALGAVLPVGTYNARVSVRMGEYHFIANDVETSGGPAEDGMTIFLAELGGGMSDTQVYWDDITILQDPAGTSTLPDGESSGIPAGRHTWGNFTGSGFGNVRFIDTYVFGLTSTSTVPTQITVDDTPLTGIDGTVDIAGTTLAGADLIITVVDADLDSNPAVIESVGVDVVNDATGELEQIILTETGPNTGVFTGSLPTAPGTGGTNNDGTLVVEVGNTVTVTYRDQLDSGGSSVDRTDTGDIVSDVDGDGIVDPVDQDDDNDGIPDVVEGAGDTDLDGIADSLDIDSDNDGIVDNVEAQGEGSYTAPTGTDSDNDGLDDAYDASTGGTPIVIENSDGTDQPDYLDDDSDNDGVPDLIEGHDSNSDGVADTTPAGGGADADGDGLNDSFDTVIGPAAGNESGSNSPLQNTDGVDSRDWRDTDDDNDGALTPAEDGNSNGDFTDDDADSDGRPDYLESATGDDDDDGIPAQDDPNETDPCIPDNTAARCDRDNDGVDNGEEAGNGTDPDNPDTDGDGIPDGVENQDADDDGINDGLDTDSDNDGIPDATEAGPMPAMPVDTDADGLPDYNDPDSDDDGIPDSIEDAIDTDADGIDDYRDPDSDDDGLPDTVEDDVAYGLDSDGDGVDDGYDVDITGGSDANGDGVDDALQPQDNDGDSVPNYLDIDSDNDGIPDTIEADLDVLADGDGDQINDEYDVDITMGPDADGDGVDDTVAPTNTDTDDVPDYLDLDADNDSLPDVIESGGADSDGDAIIDDPANNEGSLTMPTDSDVDGTGDWREIDSNNDGINDNVGTEFEDTDGDGDGVVDDDTDTDNDGIPDTVDQRDGFGTAPDADGDGILDDTEGPGDSDGDGIPDFQDPDSDNDDIPDSVEAGPDPLNPVDTDDDGLPDYVDPDSDNDGIDDELEGTDDFDNDGIPDYIDVDEELETALEGSGGVGWFMLLALGGLAFMRRMRIRGVLVVALVAVAFTAISLPKAHADSVCGHYTDPGNSDYFYLGDDPERDSVGFAACWYGGIGLGYSYVSPDEEAQNFFHDADENHDGGWHVFVGRQFSPNWFAELKYADLGEAGITNRNPAVAAAFPNAAITYKVPSLMAGYQWRATENWKPFLKAGVSSMQNSAKGGPVPFEEQTSAQFAFGTGIRYDAGRSRWFLRGEVDWYDRDAWYAGVTVGMFFGRPGSDRTVTTAPEAVAEPIPPTPKDSDGDGVIDENDRCTNTPAGVVVDATGCNADRDGDGVLNERDRCPNTSTGVAVDVRGCEIKDEIRLPGVQFETNSDQLRPNSTQIIDEAARTLAKNPTLVVEVAGHTDSQGSAEYNQGLSERRAKTVRDYLIGRGVAKERLSWRGYGESQPIASNDSAEGREQNRRVVLRIIRR